MFCIKECHRRPHSKESIQNSTFLSDWLLDNIEPKKCIVFIGQLIEVRKNIDRKSWKYLFTYGYAEKYDLTEEEIVEILKSKIPQIFPNVEHYCNWCKGSSCLLHDHHYPMKKSKGGQETIKICPSCHCEFHFLLDTPQYRLTKKIQEQVEWCRQQKIDLLKKLEEVCK